MSKRPLFDDLLGQPVEEVEAAYQTLLEKLSACEAKRKQLYTLKKIHSETIKFAVNKTQHPPSLGDETVPDVVLTAIEQKQSFTSLIEQRDDLVHRMVIPRHRAEQNLIQYHERLTKQTHYSEAPNLATEIEMFSKFFELQAMLEHFKDHQTTLKELRTMRTSLLENVKTINKEDRRLAQALSGNADEARKLRREAGRLRSYLQKHTHVSAQQLPAPIDDMNQRLASGQALSMEEFAAMLQHGGLTDLPSATKNNKGGKRKKNQQRKAAPRRGKTGKGKSNRA